MRLIITGGGTGGHIYPALEVGRLAAEHGFKLSYFGSLRGQERAICSELGIRFRGFPSEPLYSLRTIRGIKSLLNLQKARMQVRKSFKAKRPAMVFSTGGYSSGPVVAAARDLKIPYVIHSSDSIPAKSSSMFAKKASAFTCTFRSTVEFMTEIEVIRTGQPIRQALRETARYKRDGPPVVLVVGGSQGSLFLNETVPQVAALNDFQAQILHVCGPDHAASTSKLVDELNLADRYEVVPYLKTEEMIKAYLRATVVVARSGGTLAELALFGLPSVLIPLPSSANNHQFHNAMEFVNMNAATLLNQPDCAPAKLSEAIGGWLSHGDRREIARKNLHRWNVPDATERIVKLIEEAVK